MSTVASSTVCLRAEPETDVGVDLEARVIRGLSVITVGEAIGHKLWIDATMLQQVVDAAKNQPQGVPSRFHHQVEKDALGSRLGKVTDFRIDGNRVRADLIVSANADNSPNGKLGAYVLGEADEDPRELGASIHFNLDVDAMEAFALEHTKDGEFTSPDPANTKNLPHARLKSLKSVDLVGDPATNPAGLFEELPMSEAPEAPEAALMEDEAPAEGQSDISKIQADIAKLQEAVNALIAAKQEMAEETEEEEEAPAPAPAMSALSDADAELFLHAHVGSGRINPAQVEGFKQAMLSSTPEGAKALMDTIRSMQPSEMFGELAQASSEAQGGKQSVPAKPELEGEALYESEWAALDSRERKFYAGSKERFLAVRAAEDEGKFI